MDHPKCRLALYLDQPTTPNGAIPQRDAWQTATERLTGNGDWLPDVGGSSTIGHKM
jgi:hypothetical protein